MATVKMTPRKIKGLQTKRKIYNAAITLFLEKGFDEVTVDEIVSYTGTSKGAFYNHFKSKNDILIEKVKEFDSYYLGIQKELPQYGTVREKLHAFVKAVGEIPEIKGYRVDLMRIVYCTQIKYSGSEEPFLLQKERPAYRVLREIIEEGQKNGEITNKLSTDYIIEMFARCIRAAVVDWCLYNGEFDFSENLQKFFSSIFSFGIFTNRNST